MKNSFELESKKIITIGGCVRSGTTLLNLVVANDERAMALGELQYIFRPNRKQHLFVIKELKKDPIWSKILKDGPSKVYENLFTYFPNIDYFVDSTKDSGWYKEQMSLNPNVEFKNLVIFKHPDDQKASLLRRHPKKDWKNKIQGYYTRYFLNIDDFRSVSLPELLFDEDVLKNICVYLGLDYFDNKLEYWNRKHPNFYGSDTVRKSKIDKSRLKEIKLLSKLENELGKSNEDLLPLYEFMLERHINLESPSETPFSMSTWQKYVINIRSFMSDKKRRLQLWYRDYVKDREWLKDEK